MATKIKNGTDYTKESVYVEIDFTRNNSSRKIIMLGKKGRYQVHFITPYAGTSVEEYATAREAHERIEGYRNFLSMANWKELD